MPYPQNQVVASGSIEAEGLYYSDSVSRSTVTNPTNIYEEREQENQKERKRMEEHYKGV